MAHQFDPDGFEMDHVCYRVETNASYDAKRAALLSLGVLLTETNIGGRPIAMIQLHEPIRHAGFEVACVELPAPKPGRHYAEGLEHAELVVGRAEVEGATNCRPVDLSRFSYRPTDRAPRSSPSPSPSPPPPPHVLVRLTSSLSISQDGCVHSKGRLLEFVAQCKKEGVTLEWDYRAVEKPVNADVSTSFAPRHAEAMSDTSTKPDISCKFHMRPITG